MGNAVSYFDDFVGEGDFLNGGANNNENNNSSNSTDNNSNHNSESDGNISFFNKYLYNNPITNFNNNNKQSFINITEEELELRRKQRESDKSKNNQMHKEELKRQNSAILIQKHWKGFSQRKKYSLFLTKIQVFKELLITEKDYIQYLDIIIRVYSNPLKNLALQCQQSKKDSVGKVNADGDVIQQPIHGLNLDEAPLTLDECKTVFSQIEVILLYNSQLFEKLRSRLLSNFINKYGNDQSNSTTSSTTTTPSTTPKNTFTPSTTPNKNTVTPNKNTIGSNKTITPSTTPNKTTTTTTTPNKNTTTSTTPSTTPTTTPNRNSNPPTTQSTPSISSSNNSRNTANLLNSIESHEKNPIGFYQEVGDIFLEMIDFLKVPYSHYIINFPMALKVLENASKRPAFMLFSQQCKSLPEVARRDLQSFVSMPIQRIPRYVLLLRELLKFTVPGHSDHTNIELAVKRMEAIANLINRQMKEDETSKEVFQINQKLKPPIPNLVEPHRKIIKEGMVKIYKVDGNSHDNEISTGTIRPASILSIAKGGTKYIFLFNDLFVITKKKKTHYQVEKILTLEYSTIIDNYKMIKMLQQEKELQKNRPISPQSQKGTGSITNDSDSDSDSESNRSSTSSLSSLSTSNVTGSEKKGERFYFKLHTLETSIVVCLPTESEKDDWKNNFITVINRITENSLSFNPKWSKNDLIYGEKQRLRSNSTSALKRGSFSPENFALTKSIAELLAISKPIKGMNSENGNSNGNGNTGNTPNKTNNNVNTTTTTTTTTTTNTNNNDETNTTNSKDTNGTDETNGNRSRSASVSGFSGTFERLLQVIKS